MTDAHINTAKSIAPIRWTQSKQGILLLHAATPITPLLLKETKENKNLNHTSLAAPNNPKLLLSINNPFATSDTFDLSLLASATLPRPTSTSPGATPRRR